MNAAYDAFTPSGGHDTTLNVAVGAVAVGRRCDNNPASKISVMVVMMVVVFKVPVMVVMVVMVMMVVILCELYQRFRLSGPAQFVRKECFHGIRNRF